MHKFILILTALITIILLGPYVGIHVLGTRPALPSSAVRAAPTPVPAPPKKVRPSHEPDRAPAPQDGHRGESGKLSEIEELLR